MTTSSSIQLLYEIAFFVGVTVVAGFASTCALSSLALVHVATTTVLCALAAALAILGPINVLFWCFNRRRAFGALTLPISPRMFDIAFGALMGVVVLWLLYGWIALPAAPIRPIAQGYVDKLGRSVTERDYLSHLRWEAAFFSAWSATILLGVIALPFYSSKEQKHVFRGHGH